MRHGPRMLLCFLLLLTTACGGEDKAVPGPSEDLHEVACPVNEAGEPEGECTTSAPG